MARKFGTPGAIVQPPASAGALGQGVKYPIAYDSAGRLSLSFGVQSVAEAMQSIIETAPGERVMEPDYGAAVGVFDPVNPEIVQFAINDSTHDHEPRIESVETRATLDQGGTARVSVGIKIRDQAGTKTLTFPYFAGPSIP